MNQINEKIGKHMSFRQFLVGLSIFAAIKGTKSYVIPEYVDYKFAKNLYTQISTSSPNKQESDTLEKMRKNLIDDIKKTKLYNKIGQQFIIDSIQSINFIVVDSSEWILSDQEVAFYIPIKNLDYDLLTKRYKPSKDNYIFLKRENLESKEVIKTLRHELNHYFDRLLGKDDRYSKQLEFFLDKKMDNKEYVMNKIADLIHLSYKDNLGILNTFYITRQRKHRSL